MKIPKYWHHETKQFTDKKGKQYFLSSWGSSLTNINEAKELALSKINQWVSKLERGEVSNNNYYHDNSLREELIEEVMDDMGNLVAAITRNRYGAKVLNTNNFLIADVDAKPVGLFDKLLTLLGVGKKAEDKPAKLNHIKNVAAAHPGLAFSIYETCAGFRVFVTGKDFNPTSEASDTLLNTLGSDELYKTLCKSQQCYRARLTPKPWRCSTNRPPNYFPRETPEAKRAFDEWLVAYTKNAAPYSVCIFVEKIGSAPQNATFEKILALHDSIVINKQATQLA